MIEGNVCRSYLIPIFDLTCRPFSTGLYIHTTDTQALHPFEFGRTCPWFIPLFQCITFLGLWSFISLLQSCRKPSLAHSQLARTSFGAPVSVISPGTVHVQTRRRNHDDDEHLYLTAKIVLTFILIHGLLTSNNKTPSQSFSTITLRCS